MKKSALWIFPFLFFPFFLFGMADEPRDTYTAPTEAAQQTYSAAGKIKSIAEDHMSLRIFHDPVPELQWHAMNMSFEVIDHDLALPLEVGDTVRFEFIRKEGKLIIIKISK